LMDLPPCAMCIWQRWPHAAAVAIGLLALRAGKRRPCIISARRPMATAAACGQRCQMHIAQGGKSISR
ncbi:MAG: disulfide bond formation protein B, partial [Marivivens sp.]|nr:disulfide bond formation protein B [Marivivens sp.]